MTERYPQNAKWKCRLENSNHCCHVSEYESAYAWEGVLKSIYIHANHYADGIMGCLLSSFSLSAFSDGSQGSCIIL